MLPDMGFYHHRDKITHHGVWPAECGAFAPTYALVKTTYAPHASGSLCYRPYLYLVRLLLEHEAGQAG